MLLAGMYRAVVGETERAHVEADDVVVGQAEGDLLHLRQRRDDVLRDRPLRDRDRVGGGQAGHSRQEETTRSWKVGRREDGAVPGWPERRRCTRWQRLG